MPSYLEDKEKVLLRLRKMEGQIKGIQRMVEQDKYCIDILNQLSSVIAATQKVASIMMRDHIRGCVREALTHNGHGDQHIDELLTVVERFTKTG
ncbi:MAG: hypothetical protein A2147_02610 [Chloroflexi bacterium RBG_16_57_8]|nr:MAG: hypothetical protein A2147_02610 [Chloroflexi bacterium RBG_16_57_8]